MATETTSSAPPASMDALLNLIRPSVRARHPYLVGMPDGITVKLNQNESPLDLPRDLKEELARRLVELPMNRYPSEQPWELVDALADYNDVSPESIIVGNGSNELTYTLGLCMVSEGTPVVLPTPMFSLYTSVMRFFGADLTTVGPRETLHFDTEAILEAVARTQPALVVLTTPNNPTGLAMPMADVERIVQEAPGFVVVDEAYVELNPEGPALDLLARYSNVIILRTLSKAFGLAGVRLGYLMAHPDVARELFKSRLPFMVDRLSEETALLLLKRPGLIEERVEQMRESQAALTQALSEVPSVEVVPSQANFVLFKTPHASSTIVDALAQQGVLVRNMSGYPELQGYVRVNAGTEAENRAFLAALNRTLA